ncbi:MAG TPA: chemotaxis protein CheW [Rhodocyclaceae bacterium]|nr:chemotaxis protein CheW [Rhodocyclaceae bacterium]
MSYDMTQFHQVFFAEAAEHLENMETLLLALDRARPDAEQLNAIFRAAHSIKGAAGTFGFIDMADLTHALESVLDRVRHGELVCDAELIEVSLAARDALGDLLAAHRAGTTIDLAGATAVAKRLSGLMNHTDDGVAFEFMFDAEPARWEETLTALLVELADFGTPSVEVSATEAQPFWRIRMEGCQDPQGITDVIAFVASEVRQLGEEANAAQENNDAADDSFGFFVDFPPPQPEQRTEQKTQQQPDRRSGQKLEPKPGKAVQAANGETTIRVDIDKVDLLVNEVGELLITHSMLLQAATVLDPILHERLHAGLAQLERNSRDLQAAVLAMRMVPIANVFHRFPRVVHDLSNKLGKQVELKLIGEQTELDRGLVERLVDPLTHLVRNSLDHGIETPDDRLAAGKRATGTLTLKAWQHSGMIIIEVGDDGAGLDRERILAKARERGMNVSDTAADAEVWGLIFEAGFSTAEHVTDVSGRGVGMDVVRRNINALHGRIDIESTAGAGTRVSVRLPLTLAIVDGMSVAVGSETYIVPLGHVRESLQAVPSMLHEVGGTRTVLQVRDEYIPVIALAALFGIRDAERDFTRGIMVLLEADGRCVALFVDALLGQHQVVIKSLEANYRKVPGLAAATVMGDGRVAFILDAVALTARADVSMAA